MFGVIVSTGIAMILALLILNVLSSITSRGLKPSFNLFTKSSYRSTSYLCTKAEQNFLSQLLKNLPEELVYVSAKVRLADLAMPVKSKDIAAFNKVARKHVDFVICRRKDSRILMCIELDDSSHASRSAQKRDGQKNKALSDAGIPLFRVSASRNYTRKVQQIVRYLNLESANINKVSAIEGNKEYDTNRPDKYVRKERDNTVDKCPRCPNKLEKIDMKWPNKGYSFYSCTYCSFRTNPKKVE